jgi:hypothetical protein
MHQTAVVKRPGLLEGVAVALARIQDAGVKRSLRGRCGMRHRIIVGPGDGRPDRNFYLSAMYGTGRVRLPAIP